MKISDLMWKNRMRAKCFYERPMTFDCFDEIPTQTLNTNKN